ncbi:MAG: carboxypeptidase-like regulatory domain-containing protein [Bacteroidia bacterium]|nr:carboxypeptidase-like regulatory domain-containing protein [Bacteroidia bacterium]
MTNRLILCIILIYGTTAIAQNPGFVIKGKVFDSKTNAPIASVSIYVNETFSGTTTNANGLYQLKIPSTPAILVFSCVGYTRRYFTFTTPQTSEFNVPLDPSLNEIPEVIITAKRTPVSISDKQDLYVTDYDFYDNHILLLGHPGKRSTETLLVLMDRMGKRILKKEIRKGENLYRDPFNNVHLLTTDTAYQIYYDGKDIQLLYPNNKEKFMAAFPEFMELYHNKVLLRQYDFEDQALMYYFYNVGDSSIQSIWAAATPEVFRKVDRLRSSIRITPNGKGSSRFDLFNSDERFIKMAYYAPIFCPLEIINDTIYIFNFTNGLIETFGPRGFSADSPTSMIFQLTEGWQRRLYNDRVTGKVYTEYMQRGISELREINIKTGMLTPQVIRIPQFAFISKLMVHDGFLYFLYEEKLFPNFMRLYRMAI